MGYTTIAETPVIIPEMEDTLTAEASFSSTTNLLNKREERPIAK